MTQLSAPEPAADLLSRLTTEHERRQLEYELVEAAYLRVRDQQNTAAERILRGHCAYLLGQLTGLSTAMQFVLFVPPVR